MVNLTWTDSGDMVLTLKDGSVETYNNGDIAWVLSSTALVMIMSPGVGESSPLLCNSLIDPCRLLSRILLQRIAEAKKCAQVSTDVFEDAASHWPNVDSPSQIFLSLAAYAVVTFVWFFWGYSLAFSESAGKYIGDLKHFGLINVLDQPSVGSTRIPALCFNGGSALSADLRAIQACIVTNMSASVAALTWCGVDYWYERKFSVVGFCSGAISGLIAAGYVGTPASVAIGFLSGLGCNFATKIKFVFGYDDTIDIFATHAVGGFIGACLTGLFADSRVTGFDGTEIDGGWINRHWVQLGWQIAGAVTTIVYTFGATMIILVVLDHIPGCSLRVSTYEEIIGLDESQHGEFAFDFTHLHRDIDNPEAHQKAVEEFHPSKSQGGSETPTGSAGSDAQEKPPAPARAAVEGKTD
ncbi:ammonium transporter, Amt family, partial [Phenoliferia sp. Uapishka_3]